MSQSKCLTINNKGTFNFKVSVNDDFLMELLYIRYVKLYSQTSKMSSLISVKHQDVIQFH